MTHFDDYDFSGKRALVRVDFNVPMSKDGQVTDDTRIRMAIPTVKKILNDGGSVVLMSHLGRPKGEVKPELSMEHILSAVEKALDEKVEFAGDVLKPETKERCLKLKPGEVVLLENLRFHKEEEGGDEFFAGRIAELGDVYVNDAFGTAHRAHASTAVIARFFPHDKVFGKLMESEIEAVEKVMNERKPPVTAIIGGAKVSTKFGIIENLLGRVDNVIIGGGMMFTFVKAQGGEIGNSLLEEDFVANAKELLEIAGSRNTTLYLADDARIADAFSNEASTDVSPSGKIPDGWMGLDIGPEATEAFCKVIADSKIVLWNGPMGVFEMSNFAKGTKAVADALVEATDKGAFTLVGGGDSVAAINQLGLADKVSYVSTGGGAMLEYLEGKDLPGIAAIKEG